VLYKGNQKEDYMDAKQLRDGDFFEVTGTVFKMINESWEAFKLNVWTFVFLMLIPAILFAIAIPFIVLPFVTGSDAGTAIAALLAVVVVLLLFAIAVMFLPAFTITQLASVRGRQLTIGDAFNQSKPFALRFIGLILLSVLIVGVGLILFIIPGLLAIFFLSLSAYILVDKNVGVVDALKGSYELVKEYWKPVLGLYIVNIVISIPQYVPIIGWIVSLALTVAYLCLGAVIFNKIAGKKVGAKEAEVVKK
jgi:Uncharacterised protein family (UPF0259)